MPKKPMLQGSFLRRLQEENVPISIFLVSGIKLQGQVHAFDDHVILLQNNTTQLIFKHAIATIAVSNELTLSKSNNK